MWFTFAMIVLLGQATTTDNIATSGWVGAGLLGAVLSWLLLVHLPAKDKQVRDLLEMFRVEMKDQREAAGNVASTSSAAMATAVTRIEEAMEKNQEAANKDSALKQAALEAAIGKNTLLLTVVHEAVKKNGGVQ